MPLCRADVAQRGPKGIGEIDYSIESEVTRTGDLSSPGILGATTTVDLGGRHVDIFCI